MEPEDIDRSTLAELRECDFWDSHPTVASERDNHAFHHRGVRLVQDAVTFGALPSDGHAGSRPYRREGSAHSVDWYGAGVILLDTSPHAERHVRGAGRLFHGLAASAAQLAERTPDVFIV